MNYDVLCDQIIKNIGGKDNVETVVHCITRLRFTLKNREIVNEKAIIETDGVIDVVSNKVAFQIIIGTEVSKVYAVLCDKLGITDKSCEHTVKIKGNPIKKILTLLSEVLAPLIPVIMCSGMIAGVLSIFTTTGLLAEDSSTYIIFSSVKNAMFFFLPVFTAISASKRLGVSPYVGTLLAVTLLSTTIDGVEGLSLFDISLPATVYSNTFIPILLALWFMGLVTTLLKKKMPQSLDYFFTPLLTILIGLPVTLFIFGPLGMWISDGLGLVFSFIANTVGNWLVVALYAALQPLLILTGTAYFVMPLVMDSFTNLGYDPIFTHAGLISDLAVCGAMLGYFLRTKDMKQKQMFGVVSFSAFMNITEPAVFGVFAKYRRPFIAVMIGGGLGGLIAGFANVKSYAFTTLLGLPTFIVDGDMGSFYMMLIALGTAFVVTLITSYILGIPEERSNIQENKMEGETVNLKMQKTVLQAPVTGTVIPLSDIKDQAFSTGALGNGLGIIPKDSVIKSPVTGTVVSLFPTKHALGIQNEDGIEVLIHIGIDTVELNGKPFVAHIAQGDAVTKGQPLITVDFDEIKAQGYDPTVIMVITNTNDYLDVITTKEKDAKLQSELITVVL